MTAAVRRTAMQMLVVLVASSGLVLLNPHTSFAVDDVILSGTVTTQSGQGVGGVAVTATAPGGQEVLFGPSSTDNNGVYELAIAGGTYDIHFAPPSGSDLDLGVQTDFTADSDAVLNVVLVPAPPVIVYRTLSGTLRDAAGSAVSGARVIAGGWTASTNSTTDAAGHYSLTLPSGHHQLRVAIGAISPGFGPELGVGPTSPIDLTAGDVTQDLQMPPQVNLTVVLKDTNGNILGGNIISQGHGNATLLPNDPTAFPLTQIIQGNTGNPMSVVAGIAFGSGPPLFQALCAQSNGQYYCAPAQTVTQDTVVEIIVPVPPVIVYRTLSGILRDATGAAVSGTRVSAGGWTSTNYSITDAAGHYSLSLPSGHHQLSVAVGAISPSFGPQLGIGPTTPIDLTAGDVIQNLQMPPRVNLTVVLKDSNGVVLGGSITSQGHGNATLLADNPALFAFTQVIQGNAGNPMSVVAGLTFGSGPPLFQALCVNHNNQFHCAPAQTITQDTVVEIIVPVPPVIVYRTLSGILRDAGGTAVSGARVIAGNSWDAPAHTVTSIDGEYSMSLPSGHYPLSVTIGVASTPFGPQFGIGPTTPIDLTAGDVTQDLKLPPRVNLTVILKDSNGGLLGGSLTSVGRGTATLLPGNPTTFPTNQILQGGSGTTFSVMAGLGFNGGQPLFQSLCIENGGRYYCAPAQTISADTTIVIQQQPAVPATPTGLTAQTPTRSHPQLTWNAVPNVASYRIFRDGAQVGQTTEPSFVDASLNASGSHDYRVAAVNAADVMGPQSSPATVTYDITMPVIGGLSWSANPIPIGGSAVLTAAASDAHTTVAGGEYYIGTDPGEGSGIPAPLVGTDLSVSLGSTLGVGVYDIAVRARDEVGNWSLPSTTMLVVYDPTTAIGMNGKNKKDLIPSLANGDILPGLISDAQADVVDYGLTVEYKAGVLDPRNDFHFTYNTGTKCHTPSPENCHSFDLNTTSFTWLVVDQTNGSRGRFQGVATITVDGVSTSNPFTVDGIDGDRLIPITNDRFQLRIFAPGADPSTASPIYRVSGTLPSGNSIRIR